MQACSEDLEALTNVAPSQFKNVMRRFASTVCVITAGRELNLNGMTATAVCGVSAEPPSILIVVNRENRSHALIEKTRVFAVNILSSEQQGLALHFSSRPAAPFASIAYRLGSTNAPILEDCTGYLECVVDSQLKSGTHSIFVGRVVASGETDRLPLGYRNGAFSACG